MEIPIPKMVVKVETEQQEELVRLVIPVNMAGRFLSFVGEQVEGIVTRAITPSPLPSKFQSKEGKPEF